MPTVEEMRTYLLSLYGKRWHERVRKMKDNQIYAAYTRIQSQERERKKK